MDMAVNGGVEVVDGMGWDRSTQALTHLLVQAGPCLPTLLLGRERESGAKKSPMWPPLSGTGACAQSVGGTAVGGELSFVERGREEG